MGIGAPANRECRGIGPRTGQNRTIEEARIRTLVLAKWSDYRPVLPSARVDFLDREPYLGVARTDSRVAAELTCGWFEDFESEFRDPVLADPDHEVVTVCPPLMREVVAAEPPRIQRAYVEGAFLRRLFRFLVDGEGWEAEAQIRDVMARHYPFHLAAVEAVESGV